MTEIGYIVSGAPTDGVPFIIWELILIDRVTAVVSYEVANEDGRGPMVDVLCDLEWCDAEPDAGLSAGWAVVGVSLDIPLNVRDAIQGMINRRVTSGGRLLRLFSYGAFR